MIPYPAKLIRGIPNSSYLDKEGRASYRLFNTFQDMQRTDNYKEASINWYDEEEALLLIFNQKKQEDDDNCQFQEGAAILLREELDRIVNNSNYQGTLKYNRDPINGNKYHGNLLCRADSDKQLVTMIASCIAMMCVEKIEKPPGHC
ncbi:MAG: hypothetical protein LBK06_00660 [Planctomycetaceae bacterium]|jgi:hypothetical protein|nr:hypothetical protein [Planctomycetaceae bacterium]